ncbi:MAG TPA: Crp/Fnr family transcriptional regulator [Candidatus Sphingobacterium stercoripullorum]|uniref:Crp/Fnr family transcriptional regulator n=1 Tax=Candidatus Sphingobacterium stercoripullorum TaxID=2838759 RepID=A0A9D1WAL7_9SPHI|nr:Crp/Fnr family transcriptional regulator [Candidatus Sphingobacterium stercoripullorum]
MKLDEYLKKEFSLDKTVINTIVNSGKRLVFQKGDLIIPAHHYSRYVYFVEKGLTRIFYYKEDKLVTHYFFLEGEFLGNSDSLLFNKESNYGIEALEPETVVFRVAYEKIMELAENNLAVNKIVHQILFNMLASYSSRLNSLQFESAQDRYKQLLANRPQIILRAALGDIASYLGISQQTLSVIRSQIKE